MATINFSEMNIKIACRAFRAAGFFGCPRNYQDKSVEQSAFNVARKEFGLECSPYIDSQEDFTEAQYKELVSLAYAYMRAYNIEVKSYLTPISRFRFKI